MKKLKNISKLINLMSQHYTNSMDEICVPVIKKILGHYLELNPNYNNGLQRNQQPNGSSEEKWLTIKVAAIRVVEADSYPV